MVNARFWHSKRVFITGHTGFKGAWLSIWLNSLGATVTGYALQPPDRPNLFESSGIVSQIHSVTGDIRDKDLLLRAVMDADPDILFHLVAQPIVRRSYHNPVETYEVNVMGTVYLLEAVRSLTVRGSGKPMAVINVTSDKCYENREWHWGYRENDRMGGYDPYSNSKACSELVTSAYRSSFFHPQDYSVHGVSVSTARAGNVIGGGDWAEDRLVPDCVRSLLSGKIMRVRNPQAIRPWQHVLDPLAGYLTLAQQMVEYGPRYASGWNFGPDDGQSRTVEWIVQTIASAWGRDSFFVIEPDERFHESKQLKLDCSKAYAELNWSPRWNVETALDKVLEWVRAYQNGEDMSGVCLNQIEQHGGGSRS